MEIVLISPCNQDNEWKDKKSVFVFPPLALACLKSVTPARHSVRVIDETITPVEIGDQVDLVGISILTPHAPRGYEIADSLRQRGLIVVLGGIHTTLCPDEAAQHADAIVVGEGEEVWPRLLDDFEQGKLQPEYRSELINLQTLPPPDHGVFDSGRYRIPQTVMASRGCPHGCSFCATPIIFGKRYRTRNIEDVVAEIRQFPRRFFIFLDDNLFFNKKYAKQLMKQLIPLKKRWVSQATFNVADDEELLTLARKAGCLAFLIGFETVAEENFKELGKPVDKIEMYKTAIRQIHQAGILIQGSFIFGFDGDKEDTFQRTCDFIWDIGIDTANFCTLTPIPGTPLFEKMDQAGRIISRDWSQYTRQKVVFQPLQLTPRQLAEGRLQAYRMMYSLPSMLRRMPFRFPHFFWFWLYNISFRIGVHRSSKMSFLPGPR